MFRCDAIVVILGCYYYDLVSRSVRMSPELDAKIMNYHQKMQEIQSFFVTLHPNLGNLNKSVWLPQAFRKDFAP